MAVENTILQCVSHSGMKTVLLGGDMRSIEPSTLILFNEKKCRATRSFRCTLGLVIALTLSACGHEPRSAEPSTGAGSLPPADPTVTSQAQALCGDAHAETFRAKATAYYPHADTLEGGFKDRKGHSLGTLQGFLAGKSRFVSIAMDVNAFPYGTVLYIPSLNEKYKKIIPFQVVDTGGAFKNRGKTRLDICVANNTAAHLPEVNTTQTLIHCAGK